MTDRYYREVDGVTVNGKRTISLIEYRVVRKTEKGVWIAPLWDQDARFKHFILDGLGRRHAYPTRELARNSYIRRKQREIQHCANQHDKAVELLAIAKGEEPSQPEMIPFSPVIP